MRIPSTAQDRIKVAQSFFNSLLTNAQVVAVQVVAQA